MRLISKGTVEEAMLKCAEYKLRLEEKMITNKEGMDERNALHVHLAKFIPWQFLKQAVCKYPTTVNNSEIYILLPKPCP